MHALQPPAPVRNSLRATGGGSQRRPQAPQSSRYTTAQQRAHNQGSTATPNSWAHGQARPPGMQQPDRPMNQPSDATEPQHSQGAARLVHPRARTRFGTLNVLSLREGDAEGLAVELARAGVSVCGLQEARLRGVGQRTLTAGGARGWVLAWSGPPSQEGVRRQHGVAALISPAAARALKGTEAISDRLMLLHFRGTVEVSVAVAYAPTNAATPASKEAFYHQLQAAAQGVPEHRMLIVLGDMNAQVGRDVASWGGIIGGFGSPRRPQPPWSGALAEARRLEGMSGGDVGAGVGLGGGEGEGGEAAGREVPSASSSSTASGSSSTHGSSARESSQAQRPRPPGMANNNGRRCLQFCAANSLLVANTFFQHPDHHTASWTSNTGTHWAAIDLVLVSRRFRSSVQDTRVLPGAVSHFTDHRLVVCDIKLRLKASPKPAPGAPKFNAEALEPETPALEGFQAQLAGALAAHTAGRPAPESSEAEFNALESALLAAAATHAGPLPRRPAAPPWLTRHTLQLSEQKRWAYQHWQGLLASAPQLPEQPSPLDVVTHTAHAAMLASARSSYKALCKHTRAAARHDRRQYLNQQAATADRLMRHQQHRRAYKVAAELRGESSKGAITALRTAEGLVFGSQVASALGQHFHTTLNVPTQVNPEVLGQIPLSPHPGDSPFDVAVAATAASSTRRSPPQPSPPPRPRTRRQAAAQAAHQAGPADAMAREAEVRAAAADRAANGEPPSAAEVEAAIKSLRNTAPGLNGVQAQLLKAGGAAAVQWVHRCISAAWNTGAAPQAWKRAALVPIYKKGDKLAADNYRGVTLLDVVGKVYVTVVHSRIRAHLCSQLLQSQCGFVPGKGTGEAMFRLRRLVELARDYATPLHAAFVDFRKAFDSVNRATLWRLLRARGVSHKLVELVEDLYSGCEARVSVGGHESEWFPMGTGVRQGCPMSPTLFNVFMDFIARLVSSRCRQQGVRGFHVAFRISGQLVEPPSRADECLALLMLLYADDLALLADSQEGLEAAMGVLQGVAAEWGMAINYPKTKAVAFGLQGQPQPQPLQVPGGEEVGYEQQFCYLGGVQEAGGSLDVELGRRLKAAGAHWHWIRSRVCKAPGVSLNTRKALYKAFVVPTLLYGGAESWAPTDSQLHQLDAFNTSCLRSLLGASRRHPAMISNEELYELTGMQQISAVLRKHRMRWLGHVARMPDTAVTKKLLFAKAPAVLVGEGGWWSTGEGSRRAMGGPSGTWNTVAQGDVASLLGGRAGGWYRLAQDRPEWMHRTSGREHDD